MVIHVCAVETLDCNEALAHHLPFAVHANGSIISLRQALTGAALTSIVDYYKLWWSAREEDKATQTAVTLSCSE